MAEDSIHDETSPPAKALFWIVWDYTSMFRDDPWSVSFIELTSMIVSFIKLTSGPHARAHTHTKEPQSNIADIQSNLLQCAPVSLTVVTHVRFMIQIWKMTVDLVREVADGLQAYHLSMAKQVKQLGPRAP